MNTPARSGGDAPVPAPEQVRAWLREIARGTHGARALDESAALGLWSALLDDRLPEAVVGAVLVAYRFKGESVVELDALRRAAHARAAALAPVDRPLVVLPCYNGARRLANLTLLTALALRAAGFAVLMHGVRRDPGRLATAEVVAAAGLPLAESMAQADAALASERLVFLPLDVWCPALSRLLARRAELGVRNSGHTVCKLLSPDESPQGRQPLLLVPVTHAEYVPRATTLLADGRSRALVFRGIDGEPTLYPHTARTVHVVSSSGVREQVLTPRESPDPAVDLDAAADARATARWSDRLITSGRALPHLTAQLVDLAIAQFDPTGEPRA